MSGTNMCSTYNVCEQIRPAFKTIMEEIRIICLQVENIISNEIFNGRSILGICQCAYLYIYIYIYIYHQSVLERKLILNSEIM